MSRARSTQSESEKNFFFLSISELNFGYRNLRNFSAKDEIEGDDGERGEGDRQQPIDTAENCDLPGVWR